MLNSLADVQSKNCYFFEKITGKLLFYFVCIANRHYRIQGIHDMKIMKKRKQVFGSVYTKEI